MKIQLASLASERASGVFRCAPLREPQAGAWREIVLQRVRDKDAFLNAFAQALQFPEYFGHNWDAFYDCLGDVEGEQLVLLLRAASEFARAEPEEFAAAIDTLTDAAELWRESGRSLLVAIELETPLLAPELQEVSVRPA